MRKGNKMLKDKKITKMDERQEQILFRSYQLGFWTMVLTLMVSFWFIRLTVVAHAGKDLMLLALLVGITVQVVYATIHDASIFVDKRFGKNGYLVGGLLLFFGIITLIYTIWETVQVNGKVLRFLSENDTSLMILGFAQVVIGSSILYRLYLNDRENKA
ncbi:hypothetical protein [Streptococcus sp. CSL10205-OR2]|uniref:hypothetical protein n=1 Tax=Streptococcus sp. CSL10205-OR2 TaxID=2980558 RepID=UPI0021D92683|nr:hypothetical protein [Streptococcus sp. CSL10205-OR2]